MKIHEILKNKCFGLSPLVKLSRGLVLLAFKQFLIIPTLEISRKMDLHQNSYPLGLIIMNFVPSDCLNGVNRIKKSI